MSTYRLETVKQRAERLERDKRQWQADRRLKLGMRPQSESAARVKPWLALGISEATWYRRGLNVAWQAQFNKKPPAEPGVESSERPTERV